MNINKDIKLVRELTRYISPAEIEKARFKKFNTPKINDGNLACDDFFRQEELFDRRSDYVDYGYKKYSIDDIIPIDRTSIKACDERRLFGSNAAYIETDLPYYVDIIGTNKRVYLEQFGTRSQKYNTPIDSPNVPGLTVDEVVNIKYYASQGSQCVLSHALVQEAYKFVKEGYPLEGVIKAMQKSYTNYREKVYEPGALTYLIQFPKQRHYMFVKNQWKEEAFDQFGASVFPDLCTDFNGNHEKAFEMLSSCRIENVYGWRFTDRELYYLAKIIFNRQQNWGIYDSELLRTLATMNKKERRANIRFTCSSLENEMTTKEILESLKSVKKKKK